MKCKFAISILKFTITKRRSNAIDRLKLLGEKNEKTLLFHESHFLGDD